jgi:hypothetical protein
MNDIKKLKLYELIKNNKFITNLLFNIESFETESENLDEDEDSDEKSFLDKINDYQSNFIKDTFLEEWNNKLKDLISDEILDDIGIEPLFFIFYIILSILIFLVIGLIILIIGVFVLIFIIRLFRKAKLHKSLPKLNIIPKKLLPANSTVSMMKTYDIPIPPPPPPPPINFVGNN